MLLISLSIIYKEREKKIKTREPHHAFLVGCLTCYKHVVQYTCLTDSEIDRTNQLRDTL